MTKTQIKKVGFYYLIIGTCIMGLATVDIYFSYIAPNDFRKINGMIYENYVLAFLVAGSLIISFVNIPVFAITGLVFLFKKHRVGLALLLWTVTVLFIIAGRMVGDAW